MRLSYQFALTVALSTSTFFILNFESISAIECSNWQPPVLSANYSPRGVVVQSAGMDTYETGPSNASSALIAGTCTSQKLPHSLKKLLYNKHNFHIIP